MFGREFREENREKMTRKMHQIALLFFLIWGFRGLNRGLAHFLRLDAHLSYAGLSRRPFSGYRVKTADINSFVLFLKLFSSDFDCIFKSLLELRLNWP